MSENKKPKDPQKKKLFRQVLIASLAATAIATGVSVGITYAIASKQLKLPSYTVTFKNWDGTILQQSKVQIGSDAKYLGETPTRPTEDYTDYTFDGWGDAKLTNVIADVEATAHFTAVKQQYHMIWYDADGKILEEANLPKSEEEPVFPGKKLPEKTSTATKQYVFSHWEYSGDWRTGAYYASPIFNECDKGLVIKNGVVTGYSGDLSQVTIPAVWENIPVTTIGSNAFKTSETNASLTKIIVPNTITELQPYAFNGASTVTDIEFNEGSTINIINEYTFSGCTSLKSIAIPDSVTYVGDYAFQNCSSLTTFKMGAGTLDFSASSIVGCTSLANIIVPASNPRFATDETNYPGMLFSKDMDVLIRCLPSVAEPSEGKIQLPSTLKVITKYAFQGCTKITNIDLSNCSVFKIDGYAFAKSSLKKFTSGNILSEIGKDVFASCNELEEINLGSSVDPEKVEWDSFTGCAKLSTITIDSANEKMAAENNVVYLKDGDGKKKTIARCLPNILDGITISDEATIIGEAAFAGCTKLVNFTVPNYITTIKKEAFSGCTGLKTITTKDNVDTLGARIFDGCTSLETIKVGKKLAFDDSGKLDWEALTGCSSVKEIIVDEANPYLKSVDGVLFTTNDEWLLRYPSAKTGIEYSIPSGVKYVALSAFDGAKNLQKVALPATITNVYEKAFNGCTSLTKIETPITLPEGCINETAFEGCTALTTIVLKSVDSSINLASTLTQFKTALGTESCGLELQLTDTTIEGYSPTKFKDLVNSLEISGTSTTSIADGTGTGATATGQFTGLYKMTNLKISAPITYIGSAAFKSCTSLTNVDFGTAVQEIGDYAFQGCVSLEDLSLPSSLITINQGSFANLPITTLDTKNVEQIGKYAFAGCAYLQSITFGTSLTKILNGAFSSCSQLDSIKYLGTTQEFKNKVTMVTDAFVGCPVKKITCTDGEIDL